MYMLKQGMRVLIAGILSGTLLASSISPISIAAEGGGSPSPEPEILTQDGTAPEEEYQIDYQPIEENGRMILYADMSKGLFCVKDKASGKIWYSTPNDSQLDPNTKGTKRMDLRSQVVIHYVDRSNEAGVAAASTANSQSSCIREGHIQVKKIAKGLRVTYTFQDLEIAIPVEYTLEEDYVSARLLTDEITEGDICYLVDVNLLPTFGAGNWEQEGYLMVPDGSGALIRFNNGKQMSGEYNQMVYGSEPMLMPDTQSTRTSAVRMPVFGTVTGENALLGVVASGDSYASIVAYNGNERCGYNAVSAAANVRLLAKTELFENDASNAREITRVTRNPVAQGNFEVRYYPLHGDDASYVGLATRYRQYLTEEKGLTKQAARPALSLELYGAVEKPASFLGIPYTKKTALTTYEQALAMVKDLQASGVEQIALRYIGWGGDGALNKKLPSKAKTMGVLGGGKRFETLRAWMEQENMAFYPEVDLIRYRQGGNGVSKNADCAKNAFSEAGLLYTYMPSVFIPNADADPLRLLDLRQITERFGKYLPSYQKLGVDGIGLGTVGSLVYANLSEKKGVYRSQMGDIYTQVLRTVRDAGLSIAFEEANAYAFPYAQRIYAAPIYSSGYDIFDEEIPFYQIVLHGYVTMTTPSVTQSTDPRVTLLKAAESGTEILYKGMAAESALLEGTQYHGLYSSTYTLWKEDAVKQQQQMSWLNSVYDQCIVGHDEVAPDVFVTTYENGIRVAVNYTEQAADIEGNRVEPLSFTVWGGTDS